MNGPKEITYQGPNIQDWYAAESYGSKDITYQGLNMQGLWATPGEWAGAVNTQDAPMLPAPLRDLNA